MMEQEGKCNWQLCSEHFEQDCRMKPAAILEGHRCRGRPSRGWGGLTGGRRVTAEECQQACLDLEVCQVAAWHTETRKCSYFETCTGHKQAPLFTSWQKECSAA